MQPKNLSNNHASCEKYRPENEYTHFQEFIDNLPYLLMIVIGATINLVAFNMSIWGIVAAGFYIFYGIVGTLCIILYVCPYCHYYDTRLCPCGYGKIAAKLRKKSSEEKFTEKFKKYIPVIVPLWIIPVVVGIIYLIIDFNRLLLILIFAFIINSYIILPLLARIYGCAHCPQKNDCPWMFA
jgi:hypothetical protein